jgi:hypothetical protein
MKKLLILFVAMVSGVFVACGPSKLEMQEMSSLEKRVSKRISKLRIFL